MNTVTITSGKYKGRKIFTPGKMTHPMGSRERLALFNMIGAEISGACLMDTFAGSGVLGIEALSRGASKVIFVDKAPSAIQAIKKNLAGLEIANEAQVFCKALPHLDEDLGPFDIILADPPYDAFKDADIIPLEDFLKPRGILGLSHPKEAPIIPGLTLLKTHRYAAAHISIYTK